MTERKYEYLDLLEEKNKRLDEYQYKVCIEENNVVVAAGAGSGKTQVLATRFAWLVMSKNIPCGKILTLTFTNKAAGEMYERIYQTLQFFANHPKTPQKEKQRAQDALAEFSEVHIQTLDSYCGSIVRQVANLYGIRPDFSSGNSENEILELAFPFVMSNREELAVKTFANPGKLQDFAKDIFVSTINKYTSLATEKNHFEKKLDVQIAEISKVWNYFIANKNEDFSETKPAFITTYQIVEKIYQNLPKEKKESPYGKKVAFALSLYEQMEKELEENRASLTSLKIATEADMKNQSVLIAAKYIPSIINAFSFKQVTGYTNELRSAIKEIKNDNNEGSGQIIASICGYVAQFEAIKNLCQLLDKFTELVNESKRQTGNLSFFDVTELSLKILLENKELRKQEKAAFEKIMIDEFQDNNGKNRDLLFLLSEKYFENEEYGCKNGIPCVNDIKTDKLFFVGDEKQSIYKFRGADVQVFNALKQDLGRTLQMNNNYRSSAELLSSFNGLFGHLTAIFDNSTTKQFEATYLPENFAKKYDPKNKKEIELPRLTKENVHAHAYFLNSSDLADNKTEFLPEKDQLSYFMAEKIFNLCKGNPELRYSDFAILDRSRNDRKYMTKWLNFFGLPYGVDQNSNLFSDGPINDIYNLCRICVYSSDLNSFAAYLTSPFAGLSEQSVEIILANGILNNEGCKNELSEDQFQKYTKALERFNKTKQLILSQSLTKTMTTLWFDYGYCYETMFDKKVALFAEQYDMLFELARQCDNDGKSPAWFVDQLAKIKTSETSALSDDVEIDAEGISYPIEKSDAVQIMTIHKSKGLQFKYVFVYGCTKVHAKAENQKVFYEEDNGLTICPENGIQNYFYLRQKEISGEKELAEFRRIIYVALTRACNEIFVVGSWNPNPSSESKSKINFSLFEDYFRGLKDENQEIPIDLQSIELKEKSLLWNNDKKGKSKKLSKSEKLEMLSNFEANSVLIEEDFVPNFRSKPSDLETKGKPENFQLPQLKKIGELDKIIAKYLENDDSEEQSEEKAFFSENSDELPHQYFGYSDFGTLAHKFLEDFVNSKMKEDFSASDFTGGVKLYKNLTEEDILKIQNICLEMCRNFAVSELGSQIKAAILANRFVKTEWAFRMYKDDILYTGSLDLIFENENGIFTIVDYKTDIQRNNQKYLEQQNCYKTAASNMIGIPAETINCKLFYLRYAKEETL